MPIPRVTYGKYFRAIFGELEMAAAGHKICATHLSNPPSAGLFPICIKQKSPAKTNIILLNIF